MYELSEIAPHVLRYMDEDKLTLAKAVRQGLKRFGQKQSRENIRVLTQWVQEELAAEAWYQERRLAEDEADARRVAAERRDELLEEYVDVPF